ncbi:transposase [Rhodoflexus sp.]
MHSDYGSYGRIPFPFVFCFTGGKPCSYQSGRTVKKGIICRQGAPLLRSLLYNCAKSAKRYHTACKEIYSRLRAKGKPHKVAMVAVMHQLVRQVFAVVKSKQAYMDDYHVSAGNTKKIGSLACT